MTKLGLLSTAAFVALSGAASAATLIDFTDNDIYSVQGPAFATGTVGGFGFTLTPSETPITFATPGPGATGDLEGENDGIGVVDDEISNDDPLLQYVTLSFDRTVKLSGVRFLDLFVSPVGNSFEVAMLMEGAGLGGTLLDEFDATEVFTTGGTGFYSEDGLSFTGSVFTFAARPSNDDRGVADYALAGVVVSEVPLPAAGFLLLGGLGGLAAMRRRKG